MADDLQTLLNAALLRIPVTEPERDRLWDAFASATDPGDLSTRILATLKRRPDDPVLQKATSELQTLAKSSVFQTPGMAPVGAPSSTAVQGVTRPVLEVASALGGESVFNLPARFGFTPSGLDTNEMRRRAQTQDFERSVQAGLWRPTAGASPQLRQAEYEQQARQELLNTGMAFLGGAVPAALDVATNPVELAARASGFGAAVDATRAVRGMRAAQRAADVGDLAAAAEQTARATQAATRAEQFAQAATRVNRGAAGLGVATGAALTAEGLESGDLGQVGQGLAVAGMSGAGAAAQSRYGTMPVQQVAVGVGRDVTLRMRDAVRRGQEIVGLRQSPENVVRQSGVFQTLTPTGAASNQVKQADFGTGQAVIAAGMKRLQAEGKLPDLNRYDMTQDYYDISRMAADSGVDQIYDTWAEAGTIAAEHLNEVIRATRQASVLYNKGQMPEAEYRRFVDQANAARAATVVDPRLDRIQGKITGLYGDRPASRAKALQYYNRVRAGKADLPPGVLDSQLPNDTVRYLRDINVERNRFISTRPSDRRVTELTDPEIGVLNAMEAELSDRLIAQLENMGVTEARKMGEAVAITLKMRNRMLENQEKLQSYAEGIPLTTPERVMRTASQGAAGGAAALALGGVTPLGAAGGAGAAFTAGRLFGMAREFVRQGQRTTTRNAEMQKWLRNIQQLQEPARYSTPQAGAPVEAPPFPDIRTWPAPKQITEGEVIDAERIYPGSIDPYAPQPRQIGVTPPPSAVVDVTTPQYQRFVQDTGRTTTPPQIPQRSSSGMGPQQGPTIDPRTGQPVVVELATPEQYVAQNTPMPRQMRQQLTQEILAQLPANVDIVMTVGPGGEMVGGVGLRSKAGAETAIEPLAAINQGLRQGAVPAPSPDYTIATTRSADGTIRSADVRSTQTNQVARRFVGPDAYRKAEAFVYSKDTRRRNSKLSLEYVDDATLLALARPAAAAPAPPPGTSTPTTPTEPPSSPPSNPPAGEGPTAPMPPASGADASMPTAPQAGSAPAAMSVTPKALANKPSLQNIAKNIGVLIDQSETGSRFEKIDEPGTTDWRVIKMGASSAPEFQNNTYDEVLAHELAHAILSKRGLNFRGFPQRVFEEQLNVSLEPLKAASKQLRPAAHAHENEKVRRHVNTASEILTDNLAMFLLGRIDRRDIQPLLTKLGLNDFDLGLQSENLPPTTAPETTPVVSSSAPFASAPQPSPSPDTAPLGAPETAAAPPSAELDMFGNPIAPPPISGAVDAQTMAPADLRAAEQAGLIINNFPVRDLGAKPTLLQYKRAPGEDGQTGSLKGVKVYDPLLGGVLTAWRDPADGQALVVNGHNRLERAKELGVQTHAVRFIQANTAKEARAIGAMMNIAEGRGTVFDAADFFRESGITNMDELQALGLPLAESKVSDGFYLSRLHRALYERVEQKQLTISAGAGIGRILPDKNDQLALLKLLDQKKGLATDVILELAEQASGIKRVNETQVDLFGTNEVSRSLMVEQAQIVAAINRRLTSDRRLFAKVGKESAAEKLAQAGNVIDAEANAKQAEQAALVLDVFNRLKSSQFAPLLNQAAERKYQGESLDAIVNSIFPEIVNGVSQAFKGRN